MDAPLLSIAIPTFNRRPYLQQTLDVLLPQITNDVEVSIFDNCSTDDTWTYLSTLANKAKRFRQDSNVGADRNMVSCLTQVAGQYVWMLCDDDLPCANAVENLLEAIRAFQHPPMLYIRIEGADRNMSNYNSNPVASEWTSYDCNSFLTEIGYWFTFASSIVVRRDCVDLAFVRQNIGTSLVPAAITLSTAGRHNQALVSDKPLLYVRSDNTGGYNGLTVFTRNVHHLFRACEQMGFDRRVLDRVYNDNLAVVVHLIVRSWSLNTTGLLNLLRFSYRYRSFYTRVAPALLRRALSMWVRR